jgi:hypothetical protein
LRYWPIETDDFPFSTLPTANLVIDAVYEGGTKGNAVDDVLGKVIPGAGNQGDFRAVGSRDAPRVVILYSSMAGRGPNWRVCKHQLNIG